LNKGNKIGQKLKKILNISLSFLMVFSLAFTTIEVVNSQPALANSASAYPCKASNGNLYGYQTMQANNTLNVYRFDVETGLTEMVMGYSNLGGNELDFLGISRGLQWMIKAICLQLPDIGQMI